MVIGRSGCGRARRPPSCATQKLCSAERARWEAVGQLVRLRAVRSRSIVGDFGEEIAKRLYGVKELAPASNAGYDLITPACGRGLHDRPCARPRCGHAISRSDLLGRDHVDQVTRF